MSYKIIIFILLTSLYYSCKSQKAINTHNVTENSNIESIKKMTVCLCIYKAVPFTGKMRKDDGSVAAYLQVNDSIDLDAFEKTKKFVDDYLKNNKLRSKNKSSLALMRCMELYDSKELKNFISQTYK